MGKRLFVIGVVVACLVLSALAAVAPADERLKGIACRSVHLAYTAPEGVAFYNEVAVDRSAEGTYFCVCGFRQGYYGIQELAGGKKVVIFSVWDPGRQNDPKRVEAERRVKLVYNDPKVRVKRFGGEGTGGQSFFDYDWKPGQTYRFLVRAKVEKERTALAAYFYVPEANEWKHLVTFSTLAGGKLLGGYYAFVEDFQRDRVSTTKARRALFGPGWVQTPDNAWVELVQARFTADANPVTNINAGVDGKRFFLVTGGETKNTNTPLRESMTRPAVGGASPADLPPGPP